MARISPVGFFLKSKRLLGAGSIGFLIGYFLLHPAAMVLCNLLEGHHGSQQHFSGWESIVDSFTLHMLPMALAFGLMGSIIGIFYGTRRFIIQDQRDLLRNIFNSLTHPFYVIDVNSYEVILNNENFPFQTSSGERTCYALTHNSNVVCSGKNQACPIEILKLTRKPVVLEHIHTTAEGEERYYEIHAYPIFDNRGKLVQMIEYTLDISDKKLLERGLVEAKERAEKANASKDLFLANVSHDLRSPMTAILGFSNLISEEADSSLIQRYGNIIHTNGDYLLHLINDLLDLSRIETGRVIVEKHPVDLRELAKQLSDTFSGQIDKSKVRFNVFVDEDLKPLYMGDADRMKQIVMNLLANAVKYTQHGEVSLQLLERGSGEGQSTIELIVSDSGQGIKEEYLEKIFEPFIRDPNAVSTGSKGVGLGLAIVKKLVELLGGKICVESRDGEGSTFSVTLPLQNVGGGMGNRVQEQKEVGPNGKYPVEEIRVLIAEDDEWTRLYLEKLLVRQGMSCEVVSDGLSAFRKVGLELQRFDLVLMDIQMPIMNGIEAAKKIREVNKNIPIIAFSAYGMELYEKLASEAGMNEYLTKPVEDDRLVHSIRRLTVPFRAA